MLLAPLAAAAGPKIEMVKSPGGIEAWLVREPSIPIIAMEVVWRDAGEKRAPANQAGIGGLLAAMLDEGAGDLNSQAFAERQQDNGISVSFSAGRDHFSLSLRSLSRSAGTAFELAELALTRPRFDDEALERLKRSIATQLIRDQEQPGTIASTTLYATAFPSHPYGRPQRGTAESVSALGREDLKAFLANELTRDRLVIGVVGDITAEQLGPVLDRLFGSLKAKGDPVAVAEQPPALRERPIVVDRDLPQSVVQFMGHGVRRDDPDYYAAYVMNYILGGGGFNSRLTVEVREKRGLAYSVYSYLIPMRESGIWQGGVATRNDQVAESLRVIRSELDRMRKKGPGEKELAEAKTFLNGSFPLQLSSNSAIAGTLVGMQLADLGPDYIDERPKLINAVTADDVRRVAERLLDPSKLLVVVVGRPVGLGG
ncbi:M16 family metallopeptidase [Desertibaculum subflavum]|uniref:M16 family metallopeptidase n=1 Tax=Desertibaculum subflavum TaxID=2268458 RepID=UPI0034D15A1E